MMKKILAALLAILVLCTCGVAHATQSPTLEALTRFTPPYTWEEMVPTPTMENIEFAKETLVYFLGDNYELWDAFMLNVSPRYAMVTFTTPVLNTDGDYIVILHNETATHYITPIIFQDIDPAYGLMDFTNVEEGIYEFYLVHKSIHEGP